MNTPESIKSVSENEENLAFNKFINPAVLQFINMLLNKWKLFVVVGFLAGVLGIVFAYLKKPQFESRLTFALDAGSNDGALSGAMNLASQLGLGFGTGQSMFDGDNILEILVSRRMVENVLLSVDSFNGKSTTMVNYYLEINGIRKGLDENAYLKNVQFPIGSKKGHLSYLQDSVLNNVYLGLSADDIIASRPDKKLSIYEVKVKSTNEKFSKIFTDRIVAETANFYTEITSRKDKETLEILEQRVSSLKGNVGASIETKASSQDANINPAFVAAQSLALKEQYNMQAYGEAYKEMFKTLEMARYQYLKKIPLLQIIDDADYPMKKIKLGKLRTGIIFSIAACFLLIFVLWVSSLLMKKTSSS